MKGILYLVVILFYICPLSIEAQTDVSISKKHFRQEKQGFSEAWNHIQNGDSFFSKGGVFYKDAFDEYLKAIVYNNSNAELNYKTGVSALLSDKKEEAASFLLKAMELNKSVAPDIMVLTARALQYEERYSEAVLMFSNYLDSAAKKSEELIAIAGKCLAECKSAMIITKDTVHISIENLGVNINSGYDDFSEVLTGDGNTLFFGSSRKTVAQEKSSETVPDDNIFVSFKTDSTWTPAISAGKDITTKFCETPVYVNSAADILYLYAGYENDGDIKMSVKKKGKWNVPERISFPVNSKGSETSFCFNPSGDEIYYISDNGKENKGGKDIYFIKHEKGRKWSGPFNAGNLINTAFDEESVSFSVTGDTLWFSSKGHDSIGGFDIFYSIRNEAGEWDSVKNAGYPVNTPWDEIFFSPSPADDSSFYFVSNRKGGFGGYDIYSGTMIPVKKPDVSLKEAPVRDENDKSLKKEEVNFIISGNDQIF